MGRFGETLISSDWRLTQTALLTLTTNEHELEETRSRANNAYTPECSGEHTRVHVSTCGTRRGTPCVKFLIAYRLCAESMLSASGDSASSMECAFRLGFVAPLKCARARGPFRSQAHGAPEELSPSARRPGISSRRERSLGDKDLHHIILIVEDFLSKTFNMKSSG